MRHLRWPRRLISVILLVFCFWGGCAAAPSPIPDHILLTWAADPRTTQTVAWRTDTSVDESWIRYYEFWADGAPPAQVFRKAAVTRVLETSTGNMNIHSITVTGLAPGKRYRYQVGHGETWSDLYSFSTASIDPKTVTFLIFGDSQSSDYRVWRNTLQQAYQAVPAAAFFINMGDLVDVGQDYEEWEAWFAATAGVTETLPIMPLTGNHECYTPERDFSQPQYFNEQFITPDNGPEGLKRQVYSFDYGDIHFVMLDTQAGEQREFIPDLLERQREWLMQDLAATTKKWKVVFAHRPLYGNKPNGVNENIRQAFAPIFDTHKVDLVFTAHDHVVARTLPIQNDAAVASPDFGTVYAATGRSGTKTYENVSAKEWNVFFYNPVEEPNYLVINGSNDVLKVKVVGLSGQLIDEWTIEKTMSRPDR